MKQIRNSIQIKKPYYLLFILFTIFLAGCSTTFDQVSISKQNQVVDTDLRSKKPFLFFWGDNKRNIVFKIVNNRIVPLKAKKDMVSYSDNTYCLTTEYEICKEYSNTTSSFSKRQQGVIEGLFGLALSPIAIVTDSLGVLKGDTSFSTTKDMVAGSEKIDHTVIKNVLDKVGDELLIQYANIRLQPAELAKFIEQYDVSEITDNTLKSDLITAYNKTASKEVKATIDSRLGLVKNAVLKAISINTKLTKRNGDSLQEITGSDPFGLASIGGQQAVLINHITVSVDPSKINLASFNRTTSRLRITINDQVLTKGVMTVSVFGIKTSKPNNDSSNKTHTITLSKHNKWRKIIKSSHTILTTTNINGIGIMKGSTRLTGIEESANIVSVKVE